jgi:hypothetical protein
MARPVGFEPTTLGSEVRCSVQLSYGREARNSSTPVVRECAGRELTGLALQPDRGMEVVDVGARAPIFYLEAPGASAGAGSKWGESMKIRNVVIVIAVLLVALVGYNYSTTGQFSVLPSQGLSDGERAIKDLEDQLADARTRYSRAARTAGVSGIDTTADAEAARMSARQIATDLDALRERLTDETEIREADELAGAVQDFLGALR